MSAAKKMISLNVGTKAALGNTGTFSGSDLLTSLHDIYGASSLTPASLLPHPLLLKHWSANTQRRSYEHYFYKDLMKSHERHGTDN